MAIKVETEYSGFYQCHLTIYTLDGQYHREDGPAVEWEDGYKSWYYRGKYIENCQSQKEFEQYLRMQAFW